MKTVFGFVVAGIVLISAVVLMRERSSALRERKGVPTGERVEKTEAEWRAELTPEQFFVTRQKGAECPFTGVFADGKETGIFACVCCGQPLFDSDAKFESGTGWPSFWQPIDENHVSLLAENGWFVKRTEVVCSRCDAHLGHVFEDGPPPPGCGI